MRLDDTPSRHDQLHPELSHKKAKDVVLTANRGGGVSALSRAQASGSTRKQLQYFDSTPQRNNQVPVKKHLINSSSNQGGLLDITGQNLQRAHGKSSAYLANSNSVDNLQ